MFGFETHHIVAMLQFVVEHVYTTVIGSYYRQLHGVGTGYHSSGAFAEILVDFTYCTALQRTGITPISLSLYVDDAHSFWENDDLFMRIIEELNKVWSTMKFTFERANGDNELSFLDVLTRITAALKLEYEFYQKPTHSGRYLDYSSHCSTQTKLNIISTETRRVLNLCSSLELAWPHLEKIRDNFINSGYPPATTSRVMMNAVSKTLYPTVKSSTGKDGNEKVKPDQKYILKVPYTNEATTRNLKKAIKTSGFNILLVTTPGEAVEDIVKTGLKHQFGTCSVCNCPLHKKDIDCKSQHVVYKAICRRCQKRYLGATARITLGRLNEHESSFRLLNNRTTLGEHALEHMEEDGTDIDSARIDRKGRRDYDNFFNTYEFKIHKKCKDTLETFLTEQYEILKIKPELNNMTGNGFIF